MDAIEMRWRATTESLSDPSLCRPLGTDARGYAWALADVTAGLVGERVRLLYCHWRCGLAYGPYHRHTTRRQEARGSPSSALHEGTSAEPGPLVALELAAQLHDEDAFRRAATQVDWEAVPPEDLRQAVRLALRAGAYLTARRLGELGARLQRDDPELEKIARVLAGPTVTRTGTPPATSSGRNQAWLRAHAHEYHPRWLALRDGELLGVADSPRELIERFGRSPGIMVTRA